MRKQTPWPKAAGESDPSPPLAMDQDPEAVYFLYREAWVEWDARVREDMVQRAAKRCVTRILRQKRGRTDVEASPPTLPLTAAWMLWPNQGRSTLGKVLGEMRISTAKKQVLQSIAGAFPGNAVLHKWRIVSSPACTLCGHPAEMQSHIQCLCPALSALKEASIRAYHNIAKRLWQGIRASDRHDTVLPVTTPLANISRQTHIIALLPVTARHGRAGPEYKTIFPTHRQSSEV